MRPPLTILSIILITLITACSSAYWDSWPAVNGGVHNRPVFREQPSIRWQFSDSSNPYSEGVVVISDDTGRIYFSNRNSNEPLFFVLNQKGEQVRSWNGTVGARSTGTITHRNGVVYILSDSSCDLYAVQEATGVVVWHLDAAQLCSGVSTSESSATPITWISEDTVMIVSNARRTFTITAATGDIVSTYGPRSAPSYILPAIPSRVDEHFLFHTADDVLYKLNVMTGAVIWSVSLGGASNDLAAAPTVDTDGSIYVGSYSGTVRKFDSAGTQQWEASVVYGSYKSSPIIFNDEYILVVSGYDTNVNIVKKSDGTVHRSYSNSGTWAFWGMQTQVLWNNDVLYLYSTNSKLGAMNTTDIMTFTLLWTLDLSAVVGDIAGAGPSLMEDGTIVFASNRDTKALVAVGCPADSFNTVNNSVVYCTPCTEDPTNEQCSAPPAAPVVEPVAEPVTSPVTEPVTSPVTGPVTSPVAGPTSGPVTPQAEPAAPLATPADQGRTPRARLSSADSLTLGWSLLSLTSVVLLFA